jgi:hypothetical protein
MMKKAITLLLCALMVFTITFDFGVAYAEGNGGNTPENRMALDEETNPEIPSAQESAEDSRYVNMTTEELYDYLSTLETQEEVQAVRDQLTPEQLAALDVYTQSQEQEEQGGQDGQSGQEPEEPAASETPVNPAQNYTEVAPLGDPVEIPAPSVSGLAIQTMDASEETGWIIAGSQNLLMRSGIEYY